MIKDQLFKRLVIPIVGAVVPFLTGIIRLPGDDLLITLLAVFYFMGLTVAAWHLVVKLVADLRRWRLLKSTIFSKLAALLLAGSLAGGALFFTAAWAWQSLFSQVTDSNMLWQATWVGVAFGATLAMVYEIIFLSLEKALDLRVLEQVDRERLEAEISVLRSELDPHFFFNCMNTLSHLVRNDADKAYRFVHNLSSVYKYFLRNKEKQYVSLQDEMDFLDNYYYLLRIRFDDNIRIENKLDEGGGSIAILPCTLQVLVENAIKHNFFSEREPLVISIFRNGKYITVSNPVRPKLHAAESTHIGLRNLKARYRIITNQNVQVLSTANRFLVKLPIVTPQNPTT
ncbi:MAG: hypothetical protein EOO14_04605 [Chitinophagaceae bacterium]|nr:MAG: hypothetical protein EOO14_04605 [Chitinophagaceae bacterium]